MTDMRIVTLMRHVASGLLADLTQLMAQVDPISLQNAPVGLSDDPVLEQSWRTANLAIFEHYLRSVIADPEASVGPILSRVGADLARDWVRRGMDDTALDSHRVGQNIAWQAWMERCFLATDDVQELHRLLTFSAESIFAYTDATAADLNALIASERAALVRGTHEARLAAVGLVLDGAPISLDTASKQLSHDLRRRQVAAVLWHSGGLAGDLEQAADALGRAVGNRPLTVVATSSSLWLWCGGDALTTDMAREATREFPQVRVALGTIGRGLEGFRQGHHDALLTQRLMLRAPEAPRVASFEDIQLVALIGKDEQAAAEFVQRTLGDLAKAEPSLRLTLRTYLREDASASRAARVLFTHRNTVLGRIGRAEALLPMPLKGQSLAVALALEIVHWLGLGASEAS